LVARSLKDPRASLGDGEADVVGTTKATIDTKFNSGKMIVG
jgi:hypothetical protein